MSVAAASGAQKQPAKTRARRRYSVSSALDAFFFGFAAAAAVWLATIVFSEGFAWRWTSALYFLAFWVLLAYLVLPRLHRILTAIYVPDYFIGRTRTSDGLLGDPVNLALLGTDGEIHRAFAAAGWTRADDLTLRSSWRIIASTVSRRSYDEAPVSPLFLFGRQQDFAYQQEVAGNPAKRHHVRFWRCPDGWLLPGGYRVDWVAAGTFDRAVGFSLFTLQVTHKIDADTDIERDHIVSSVLNAWPSATAEVIRDFSTGYHSRNGGGDSITTDGDLPVLDVSPSADAAAIATQSHTESVAAMVENERAGAGAGASGAGAGTAGAGTGASGAGADAGAGTAGAGMDQGLVGAKRPAFEPGLPPDPPQAPPTHQRRPAATAMGAVLLVLRVIGGSLWLVQLATRWPEVIRDGEFRLDGATGEAVANAALWGIVAFGLVVLLAELAVVAFVFRGRNWARIAVMIVATLSVITAAVQFVTTGAQITLQTTLLTLSLDILILLALSSRASRAYARRTVR